MCIEFTYYSKGKTIFFKIFRHQLLPKYLIFTQIQCTCSLSKKQHSLKYFGTESCQNVTLSCLLSAHVIPQAKHYSLKYFGTNSCQNIPSLYVLIAHSSLKAKQYSPKHFGTICCQKILLSHRFSAHVPKPQTIFPGVFRRCKLLTYYIVMCIKCTYYTKVQAIFSEISWH